MNRVVTIRPRTHAPWLLEVKPVGWRPDGEMRAAVEYAPGIVWDGICQCWLVPCELEKKALVLINKE
jgi:hypothetical protein